MDAQQVIQEAEKIASAFEDGKLTFSDIPTVIEAGTKLAQIPGLPNADKKALAVKLINHVIDITDTPWLPDQWSDPFMKQFVPTAIDMIVNAAKGKLNLLDD